MKINDLKKIATSRFAIQVESLDERIDRISRIEETLIGHFAGRGMYHPGTNQFIENIGDTHVVSLIRNADAYVGVDLTGTENLPNEERWRAVMGRAFLAGWVRVSVSNDFLLAEHSDIKLLQKTCQWFLGVSPARKAALDIYIPRERFNLDHTVSLKTHQEIVEFAKTGRQPRSLSESFLGEEKMELGGIAYFMDPSPNEVIGALHRSKETLLRGLVDPSQKLWVWDAYHGTHHETFNNLINSGLIDPNSDYKTQVFQIVISPSMIAAYRGNSNYNLDDVPSELFQMLLRRARRKQ